MHKPLSLYIHIPFCQVKCPYCDFYSVANADDAINAYIDRLQQEILYFSGRVEPFYCVETVFLGGGTPSYIPSQAIGTILGSLHKHFRIHPQAEITLEMNPGSCEVAKLKDYCGMGINRISLGIQSFDDRALRFLGRVHNAQEALDAIDAVRADFENFNVDLIFAIPGETRAQWKKTLQKALSFTPPHLSTYNLTYEEGTPLLQWKKNATIQPVSDDRERMLFQTTIDMLTQAGLQHYEISNFARPGKEARHNQSYWKGQDYLGLGAGAHSYFGGKRFSKKRSLQNYLTTTSCQGLDILPDEDLSPERRFWELLVIGLRNLQGIALGQIAQKAHLQEPRLERLDPWMQKGYLEMQHGVLRLSPEGLFFYDELARSLI